MYKLHPFREDKVKNWPIGVQFKFDGVCAQIYKGEVTSRTDKPITSFEIPTYLNPDVMYLAELIVPGKEFAEASGIIRRQEPQEGIVPVFFDRVDFSGPSEETCGIDNSQEPYYVRYGNLKDDIPDDAWLAHMTPVGTMDGLMHCWNNMPPECEGLVVRDLHGVYAKNKRLWTVMKMKRMETVDVRVLAVKEADAVKGVQTNMLGQFICCHESDDRIDPETFPVGPGCATHEDRAAWLADPSLIEGQIIEVEHMPTASGYDKLRQPIFKRVRWDLS